MEYPARRKPSTVGSLFITICNMAATSTLGGYDYDYVDVPLDTLLCKICLCPSREAQLTVCCGYMFCKSCILCASEVSSTAQKCLMCFSKGFTSVHNKQVDRLVRSLKIFCPNKKIGCEWQGEVNDIRYHINHCCFEEINCPNDCEVSVQRQNLTKHIETECVHRKVDCQYCHITEEYQLIEGEHEEQCPKLPLPCPNKCDIDNIPREEMNGHRKTCTLEEINCVNKCGKTLLRKDMKDHEIECVRRKVNCRYCHITGSHRFIEGKHKKQCSKLPLPCPNKCNIGIITRGDIEELLKMCPLESIQCQYHEVGCTEVIKRKYQEKHYTEEMEKHLSYTKRELSHAKEELVQTKQQLVAMEATLVARITKIELSAQRRINELESRLQGTFLYSQHLNIASMKICSGRETCPVIFKVPDFTNLKKSNQVWYSEAFFTQDNGCKMRLCLIAAGNGLGKGTHVSVYVYLLKGLFDDQLAWPVNIDAKVMLLNQIADKDHVVTATKITANRVVFTKTMVVNVDQFILYKDFYTVTGTCSFLKDDIMFFQVNCILDTN